MNEQSQGLMRFPVMTEVERAERRAFLEGRQTAGIGASELPRILMGEALEVYHEHTRPITDEDVEGGKSIHLYRGTVLEPIAMALLFRVTGWRGQREYKQVTHPDYPGAMCSPDGTVFADEEHETGTAEAKAPGWRVFRDLMNYGTSERIIWQLQHSIAVRRFNWGVYVFASLEDQNGPVVPVVVQGQKDVGEFCLETAATFWSAHVLTRTPPDPAKWAALLEKAPRITQTHEESKTVFVLDRAVDEEARALIRRRTEVDAILKLAEEAKDDVTDQIKALLTNEYPGIRKFQVPGVAKATWVASKTASSFDRALLEQHRPIDRDALVRKLMEGGSSTEDAEHFMEGLDLNLSSFQRPGREFEFIKFTPAKSGS